MEYVNLGATGLKVSRICLGAMNYGSKKKWGEWILEEEEAHPLIRRAIEGGINFFDTADEYSTGDSEIILGRALKAFASRERVVIATKVSNPMGDDPNQRGLSRKHIFHAIDDSLRRLQTDYIDLYQTHRFDPTTPMEETLEALNDLVRAGKVLHLGATTMYAWQFAKFLAISDRNGWARFVTMQNYYNLIYREEEREMNPLCREERIGLLPYSPLAQGILAGNRKGSTTRSRTEMFTNALYTSSEQSAGDQAVIDRLKEISRQRGLPPAQIALAWLLHQPGVVSPMLGVSRPQQVDDALALVTVKLSAEEIVRLGEPYFPHRLFMGYETTHPGGEMRPI